MADNDAIVSVRARDGTILAQTTISDDDSGLTNEDVERGCTAARTLADAALAQARARGIDLQDAYVRVEEDPDGWFNDHRDIPASVVFSNTGNARYFARSPVSAPVVAAVPSGDAGAPPPAGVDAGAETPVVAIPAGQDEFGRALSPNSTRSVYIVGFGARGADGNPLPPGDPALANIFSVGMHAVGTQGDYVRLEGDNGQQFRFRRPANPDAELNFEVLNTTGQWVVANSTTALPTGLRTVGPAPVVAVGDLRRNPSAGVDTARPGIARSEAARLLIDGLIADHTQYPAGDPPPDPVVDAAAVYADLDRLPESISVSYSYNGASQAPVTLPREAVASVLAARYHISRPGDPAAPPPVVADARPPRGPGRHASGGTRATGPSHPPQAAVGRRGRAD